MTNGIAQIPGFIAGTWQLDPNHSDVGFVVGHLVMSKVHGRFDAFSGTVVTDKDLARASVSVSIDAASVDTAIDRNDFGVSFNAPIPGLSNAMLLSYAVAINLDVEAVLQTDSA